MTSLAIDASFPDFDPLSALLWIEREADWLALRFTSEVTQRRTIRNGRPNHNGLTFERGVMIEARVGNQLAYAGTSDLSRKNLIATARRAAAHARSLHESHLFPATPEQRSNSRGQFHSPARAPLRSTSLADFTQQLLRADRALKVSDRIVTTRAEATLIESKMHYVTTAGGDVSQNTLLIGQNFAATAQEGPLIQQRSLNGPTARCWQAGLEAFDWDRIEQQCEATGREALALLEAEECPTDTRDLLLAPDQMLLQIHESVGHPLELDRILGDERNYAGWSFVQPADFGRLQYGSSLMSISFDPTLEGAFASYGFDDNGTPARRDYLIHEGRLLRGLGGLESQTRSGLPGVANVRSSSWNRAPIDRMANINLEPGQSSLEAMIGEVERGIYMMSNRSWSIDDYRNKFQFGCEYGRLIEEGRLTRVVKNPNYRGMTLPFWHSLAAVGRPDTREAFGTPYCGKGEPNQIIRVGHASPACLFRNIEIFGGAA